MLNTHALTATPTSSLGHPSPMVAGDPDAPAQAFAANSNTKVLFVARNIPVPGVNENDVILRVARRLMDKGVRVEVVFPLEWLPVPRFLLRGKARAFAELPARFEVMGVPVVTWKYLRLPGEAISYLLSGFRLGGGNWSFAPDVVHAHYVLPDGAVARTIARSLNKRYVITARAGDWRKLGSRQAWAPLGHLAHAVVREAAALFAPSKIIAKQFQQWRGDAAVLPHGVDLAEPGVGLEKAPSPLVIAVAARLGPAKRVDWVIKAAAELASTCPVEVRVIGGGSEEPALRALAAQLGVKAVFTGQVPSHEVMAHLQQAHVFALPSESETFGLVYLEAAVAGCAVVGTRGTGVDGLFVDGQEMVFCESQYTDFVACLRRLAQDDSRRVAVARAGRERVVNEYLWEQVLQRYEQAYKA